MLAPYGWIRILLASCASRCRPATYRQISRWMRSSLRLIIRTCWLARNRFCFRSMPRAWVVNGVAATAATTSLTSATITNSKATSRLFPDFVRTSQPCARCPQLRVPLLDAARDRPSASTFGLVGNREVFGGPIGYGSFVEGDLFPVGLVAENAGDDRGMHGVSGAVGLDVAEYLFPEQREVADEVKHFVAHELVGIAQRRVLHGIGGQHDAIVAGSAANQSHVEHGALLVEEAEGAGGRDLFDIAAVG